jgi:hypothetical protein
MPPLAKKGLILRAKRDERNRETACGSVQISAGFGTRGIDSSEGLQAGGKAIRKRRAASSARASSISRTASF